MAVSALGWREHRVGAVLPASVVEAMLDRARKWDRAGGGRFTVRQRRTIVLWSAGAHPRTRRRSPVASIRIVWNKPSPEQATIARLCWDPVASSVDEVCTAVEVLVGAPQG